MQSYREVKLRVVLLVKVFLPQWFITIELIYKLVDYVCPLLRLYNSTSSQVGYCAIQAL